AQSAPTAGDSNGRPGLVTTQRVWRVMTVTTPTKKLPGLPAWFARRYTETKKAPGVRPGLRVSKLRVMRRPIPRGRLGRCRPTSSRLRHITGVLLIALTDSGVEDARKRRRSACRSVWSLWSRCRRLCNCLDPLRLERTLV